MTSEIGGNTPNSLPNLNPMSLRTAEDLLSEAELRAKKEGINLRKEIVEESDTVEKAIIDYAKRNNIDVILIGTSGMSAAEEVFLGSVANNVIHHAHCPVFAIR
jgi:nucleotide-binding universal stress UspA family protein